MGLVRIPIVFIVLFCVLIVAMLPVVCMRIYAAPYLYSDTSDIPHAFVAIVPGASVIRGEPSPILALRADLGSALYKKRIVERILITGDNIAKSYDEVTPMLNYLLASRIPSEDILLDRSGYNTYSSLYHAKKFFNITSLIVVSQDFHLPRSVFIARMLGSDAYGLATSQGGTLFDYAREIPASWKALWDVLTHTEARSFRDDDANQSASIATTR